MELLIYKDTDELINALAKSIEEAAKEAISSRGRFNFVLSGGGSPRKLYQILASSPYNESIDWKNTFFFFGDERFVPENDQDRNSLMAKETLFEPLKIEDSQIFGVDTSGTPEEAAEKYANSIKEHFNSNKVEFDFVLLGLGNNSHTASLFPHTAVLEENEATIKSEFVPELKTYRITMTAPLINQAKSISFLVFGENKSEAVFHVLKDRSGSPLDYPARLIGRNKRKVKWFMDVDAASKL